MKRKISGCVNCRIRAGDYQHIEVVKYAEEEIEYSSKDDLKAQEDALNDDLIDCMLRSLTKTAERLGQGKAQAIEVEETLSTAIPEWLANDPVPNIANGAKKVLNTIADKQKSEKDKALATEKAVLLDEEDSALVKEEVKEEVKEDDGDLFEPDEPVAEVAQKSEPVETEPVAEVKTETEEATETAEDTESKDDVFDFFSDTEDVFGDK